MNLTGLIICGALLLSAGAACAQDKPQAAAHWEGVIQAPNKEIKITVDLDRTPQGKWIGDLDVPEQGLKDIPLSNIVVDGNMVEFEIAGIPGAPSFDGEVSPDGKLLTGDFVQGGENAACELKWAAEAKVVVPASSTSIAKELEGSWEGTIVAPDGNELRSILKLANGADGKATGTLVSVDQDGVEIPVTTITQTANRVQFELKAVGASYAGELKGDELAGTLTQNATEYPVKFKRTGAVQR